MLPRLIVALDDTSTAESLMMHLAPRRVCLKVSNAVLTVHGSRFVQIAHEIGASIMWDTKVHDIPHQVGVTVAAIAERLPEFITIHASAGPEGLAAAVENRGASRILAITILTSLSDTVCRRIYGAPPMDMVLRFADLAKSAGVDGLVCSPQELSRLRDQRDFDNLVLVTPGIRLPTDQVGDQERNMTPGQAIKAGANFIVVGRPITAAPDPIEAMDRILEDMATGL